MKNCPIPVLRANRAKAAIVVRAAKAVVTVAIVDRAVTAVAQGVTAATVVPVGKAVAIADLVVKVGAAKVVATADRGPKDVVTAKAEMTTDRRPSSLPPS